MLYLGHPCRYSLGYRNFYDQIYSYDLKEPITVNEDSVTDQIVVAPRDTIG
jgi:hypothetical protein